MKLLDFFLFLWVILALLDPDPDPKFYADPDPDTATQINTDPCRFGYGSRSESLYLTAGYLEKHVVPRTAGL